MKRYSGIQNKCDDYNKCNMSKIITLLTLYSAAEKSLLPLVPLDVLSLFPTISP